MLNSKVILKFWFVLLLLSFAYEKPILIVSSIDRINPRLFDLVTLLGIFVLPFTKQIGKVNEIFKKWYSLVIWFGISTLLSVTVYQFSNEINIFSFFYYFKYLQELFVLFVAARILSEGIKIEIILKTFLISGIFIIFYSYYEYNFGNYGVVEYAPGKYTNKPEGVVWGPFGNTYFQIANFLPLISILILVFSINKKGFERKIIRFISILTIIPLLYTGSRTGIGLVALTFLIYFYFSIRSFKFRYVITLIILFFTIDSINSDIKIEQIQTINRLEEMETNENNSIASRILLFQEFDIFSYENNGDYVPYIGAGFYVAPINGNYRIGYGFHNIYLFTIEQSGLIGLFLFLIFIKQSISSLKKRMSYYKNKNNLMYSFTAAIFCFFVAEMILGIAGHTFWRGFATNNMNTLRILVLIIATSPIILKKLKNE